MSLDELRPVVVRAIGKRMHLLNCGLIGGDDVVAGASLAVLRRLVEHPALAEQWTYAAAKARMRIEEVSVLSSLLATPPGAVVEFLCDTDLREAARSLRDERAKDTNVGVADETQPRAP